MHEAYLVLGDATKRRKYDATWSEEGEGSCAADRSAESPIALLTRLLLLAPLCFRQRLLDVDQAALLELRALLAQRAAMLQQPGRASRAGDCGLGKIGSRYTAKIIWPGLVVRTMMTPELDQAIGWSSQLVKLRAQAEATFESGASFEVAAGHFQGGGFWLNLDSCFGGVRGWTPLMLDLETVLTMREELRRATGGVCSKSKRLAAVKALRKGYRRRFEGFRQTEDERRATLAFCVQQELDRRRPAVRTHRRRWPSSATSSSQIWQASSTTHPSERRRSLAGGL